MSFYHGLSGVWAATRELDVVGNNVANARTSGFKRARAEFADVFTSFYPGRSHFAGLGVYVADVKQDFRSGPLEDTGWWSDIAIQGNGFFITKSYPEPTSSSGINYVRNSEFELDRDGYIVNNNGDRLQGWGPNGGAGGQISPAALSDIRVDLNVMPAQQTGSTDFEIRLDPGAPSITKPFDVKDITSYNSVYNITTYTAQGEPQDLSLYYVKTAPNTWTVYAAVGGSDPSTSSTISFDENGFLVGSQNISVGGIDVDLSKTTQISTGQSSVTSLAGNSALITSHQDGYPAGQVRNIGITKSGLVDVEYTNGHHQILAQIPLATFTNVHGLVPIGDNRWVETFDSGPPRVSAPGSNGAGAILEGRREGSNVDLAQELVDMIVAQRYYQVNTKTIQTHDQILQTVINIR